MLRKTSLFGMMLVFAGFTHAQTVSDDLSWVTTSTVTTDQSPDFTDCDPNNPINYRLSALTGNFTLHSSGSGAIFPAFTSSANPTAVDINLSFNTNVSNLRIKIVDLDILESITAITPGADERIHVGVGPLGPGNSISTTTDNQDYWMEFNGPISSVTFTYNRPGQGYGLIVDSVQFDCPKTPCPCPAEILLSQSSGTSSNGQTNASLAINSAGEAISSLIIELPAYQVLTEPLCRECNTSNPESYGSFNTIPIIAGTNGTAYEPFGPVGGVRKIVYNFPSPIVLNTTVPLSMIFPPSLELDCCKNIVDYCVNVTLIKDDCTSCEYDSCVKNGKNKKDAGNTDPKKKPNTLNDGPLNTLTEKNDFELIVTPNPTSSIINGSITLENFEKGNVYLYSSNGTLVSNTTTNRADFKIEISTPGTYILTVITNGKRSSEKVTIL